MRKLLVLACLLAFALAAASCSSSGGSDSGKDATSTTAATPASTTTSTTSTTDRTGCPSEDEGGSSTTTDGSGGDAAPTDVTASEYEAAFVTALSCGDADIDLVLPRAGAECVAPKVVGIITVKALNQAGVTVEDASDSFQLGDLGLDSSQGQAIVEAFGDCDVDIYAELASSLTAGLGEDVQECTAKNIDHDLADAMLAKTFSGGESTTEFEALLADLQKTCNLPSD